MRLERPLHILPSAFVEDRSACPLLSGRINLPRLQSLAVRAELPAPHSCYLLDPGVARGVIAAPFLSRVDVLASATPRPGTYIPVRAAHLANFIENHVELNNPASLELFVDTAHGVHLETQGDADADMPCLLASVCALRV
ncbi:hypothetical protein AURDEDRAFT_166528 [Auricularia subglabra TFB-10046 SS5]|nr:hypothetical protein AURDEDRAFT_166528 [Auricularia subglabra TFB-10046 SS5]